MQNFTVLEISGHQYLAEVGKTLVVDKLQGEEKEKITFDKVLLFVNKDSEVSVGKPYLTNIKVIAEITKQAKGKKIRVARFKSKSKYRRTRGFRPELTEITILKVDLKK